MIAPGEAEFFRSLALDEEPATRFEFADTFGSVNLTKSSFWPALARIAAVALGDVLALALSASIGFLIWGMLVLHQPGRLYIPLFEFALMAPFGYALMGLYPGLGLGPTEIFRRLCITTISAFLVLAGMVFLAKLPSYYSRMVYGLTLATSLVFVPTARLLVNSIGRRFYWWSKPALLAGSAEWIAATSRALEQNDKLGYRPIGALIERADSKRQISNGAGEASSVSKRVLSMATQGRCVVLVEERLGQSALEALMRCYRHVLVLMEYDRMPVENMRLFNFGSFVGVQFTNNLLLRRNCVLKRALDVVIGSILLVLALPAIAIAALLIVLFDGGPVFFRQQREGFGGRLITVWKLRTMRPNSGEDWLEQRFASDPELRRQWESSYKLKRDPRLIPVIGKILRRYSLDELPQLWNVVKGEMSLVGPRPFPDYHLKRFPADYRRLRHAVRPGLTGLWQVSIRGNGDLQQQRHYDSYYIRNWSIWLDFYILAQTFWALVAARGAY